MDRSYRNKEFIESLNSKQLQDYYDCYSHHHLQRFHCKHNHENVLQKNRDCPCHFNPYDIIHYCTGIACKSCLNGVKNDSQYDENFDCFMKKDQALIVCENYPPSYTSKSDQIDSIKNDIYQMRKSKLLLKKTMEDLDKLIEKEDECENLNEVEKFYRSNKFIGSSMNVSSLNKDLPRNDITPSKYIIELRKQKEKMHPVFGQSIFSLYNKNIFTDKTILEKEQKLKPKKKISSKQRPQSSAI